MRCATWTALVGAVALAGPAAAQDAPCKPEMARLLPSAEEAARLCPAEKLAGAQATEKGTPLGGCQRFYRPPASTGAFVQLGVNPTPPAAGGARGAAERAARGIGGGLAARRAPFPGVEAWEVAGLGTYYVSAAKALLAVAVGSAVIRPGDACKGALVGEVVRRAGG